MNDAEKLAIMRQYHPMKCGGCDLCVAIAHIDTLEAWKKRYQLRTGVTIKNAWDGVAILEASAERLRSLATDQAERLRCQSARLAKADAVVGAMKLVGLDCDTYCCSAPQCGKCEECKTVKAIDEYDAHVTATKEPEARLRLEADE